MGGEGGWGGGGEGRGVWGACGCVWGVARGRWGGGGSWGGGGGGEGGFWGGVVGVCHFFSEWVYFWGGVERSSLSRVLCGRLGGTLKIEQVTP